jgi:hypothetical protein
VLFVKAAALILIAVLPAQPVTDKAVLSGEGLKRNAPIARAQVSKETETFPAASAAVWELFIKEC